MRNILLLLLSGAVAAGANTSTLTPGQEFAWAGNLGWIDGVPGRPASGDGFRFGEFICAGFLWSANTGWIDCGDGTPANGAYYGNDGPADFGVNHSGTGDLSGLAWSPNTGWINFGWWTLDPANPNRPRVDLQTGNFSGFAWSANCGWVNLGTGLLQTASMAVTDTDSDGIADAYEIAYTGGLTVMDGTSDYDRDGFSDKAEYLALSNPLDAGSFLRLRKIEPASPFNGTATALTWTSSPARRYVIEGSNDLGLNLPWAVSPFDAALYSPDPGSETTRTSHHTATGKRFFRVRPVLPLQP